MSVETFTFQTEVGRLLDIVAHSLYTHKEIFLRELISNAADACDRLRYLAQTEPGLIEGDPEFSIRLKVDRPASTLAVIDNGIGMNREDLIETIGTIARSGSQAFLAQLTGDARRDLSLIGQFGVGFYSAFMVAERVDVISRRAGEAQAWRWSSDGKGSFSIEPAERDGRGTTVLLRLKAEDAEFLETARLREIVKRYSDHIGVPILIHEGDKETGAATPINDAKSLWLLPKREISEDQYKEFYHHVAHAFDDPWLIMHNQVEGVVSYTNLLFIPSQRPFEIFDPARKPRVRLYVKRVFITDDCEGLLPPYLRFLRGVVDSEDLPLNISRETFQHDPRLAKIRSGLVKRVLDELEKKAKDDPDGFVTFWEAFGAVLKEGIYEDYENRDRLLSLARFRSTAGEGWVSLADVVQRMKPGQEAIYTLAGEDVATLARSPQLEGFRAKGVEVLLLTDPIDEFWLPAVGSYEGKPFRSAAATDVDLSKIVAAESEATVDEPAVTPPARLDRLIALFRDALNGEVKDVRASQRLTESAVCLVCDKGDLDMYLERLLRQHRQLSPEQVTQRILEINPAHPLIRRLADLAEGGEAAATSLLQDAARLLFDQARITEGEGVKDASAFARRLAEMLERALPLPASAQA
jgi:molecular chaperone HtpG